MKYSQRSRKVGFFIFALAGLLLTQYQNCSSYSDPSPFELPSTLGEDLTNPSQISLKALAEANNETIIATGICSSGPYLQSFIEFQLFSNSGGPNLVLNVPCDHGRFHLISNSRDFCTSIGPKSLTLKGQIVINDPKAPEVRPAAGTSNNGISLNCI